MLDYLLSRVDSKKKEEKKKQVGSCGYVTESTSCRL